MNRLVAVLLALSSTWTVASGQTAVAVGRRPATLPAAEPVTGPTICGTVLVHRAFPSQFLRHSRDIWVYCPPGYDERSSSGRRYPVLYLHDGNNCFDSRTAFLRREWNVDETAERMIRQRELPPFLIVGVSNTPDREWEYTWVPGLVDGKRMGGGGRLYAQFLQEELKPFIDRTYRTLREPRHTTVLGSSLGGLVSLYLGRFCSDTFGRVGVVSPSLWWADRVAIRMARHLPRSLVIWLDGGFKEGQPGDPPRVIQDIRDLKSVLIDRGYVEWKNLGYVEDPDGEHNEVAWARRLPAVLKFLLAD
ncbi:MAG: alpha/beta hydrolase [Candidatus Riflebacteria bacterium]|nr:alpha/beta hydrolase [Candidatus Riflebacteria bacterium]